MDETRFTVESIKKTREIMKGSMEQPRDAVIDFLLAEIERLRATYNAEVDEFNAGFDKYNAGKPITDDPCGPHDTWRIGWVWAAYNANRLVYVSPDATAALDEQIE